MSYQIRMYYYVRCDNDHLYHVQNTVMGMRGQHHVHDQLGYAKWLQQLSDKERREYVVLEFGSCDCGLRARQVRDHEGNVTENGRF